MTDKHTQGDWTMPHYFDPNTKCNCLYVFGEHQNHEGSICTISVDNGKPIGEGGNDGPSLEEAQANMELIINAPQNKRRLDAAEEKLKYKIERADSLSKSATNVDIKLIHQHTKAFLVDLLNGIQKKDE